MAATAVKVKLKDIKADEETEKPAPRRVRRALRRIKHRQRGRMAYARPVMWLATIQTTAALADVTGLGLNITGPAVVLATGVTLVKARRRGQKPAMKRTSAACLWLLVATFVGPYGLIALVLWVVGIVWSVNDWWALYRAAGRPAPRPKALPKSTVSGVQKWWEETVVPNSAAFAGTTLAAPEPVQGGFTTVVVGVPGKTQFDQMEKARGTIASAREVPLDQVELGRAPGGSHSRARLTVVEGGDNLRQVRYVDDHAAAIDLETGTAQVGWFFDLKPTHWSFWTTDAGAQMGINAGSTGMGKSAFGGTKLGLVHQCPLAVAVLLDNQDGSSQPDFNGRTAISREGVQACWEELLALDYVMGRRSDFVAHVPWADNMGRERHGKPFFVPGDPDMQGLMLMYIAIEELPLLLKDAEYGASATELLADAVKTWRKPGGAVDVYLQNLGLENFGGKPISNTLRSNLSAGGSVAAFRTGSGVDYNMVGLAADPSKLPEFWEGTQQKSRGLAYTRGLDNRPSGKWRASIWRDLFGIASTPAAAQLDEMTLSFYEEYGDMVRRGVDPRDPAASTPANATPVAKPQWSSGDVEAVVEHALISGPKEVGAVCVAARRRLGDVPLGEVPAALRALEKAGRVRKSDDLYQLVKEVQ
ncbi:hypothetical protein [Nonomuraea cavernae]|uniref:Uncharacterized protein n=1 Tax=Nonomuraea cavernae TaxID=2045107 RepID=A0A917YSJ7_9ACTN|nr:hypothetical protein [Nonomuraea cavernae]MCA2184605.1 hypothetical protein [Nonomuraea cavernae]GGO63283.1 hypothetical protein GCM10012289_09960 [Nonomuraea cavernae]